MMPRISPKRRAAFDILDGLFFNQTWFLRLSEDDEPLTEDTLRASELNALLEIMKRVNEEVVNTGATGIAAQALKHTVYCMLEARFSDDLVQKTGHADRFGLANGQGVPLSTLAKAIDATQAASLHQYDQQFLMSLIATVGEKSHGVCTDTAFTVTARVAGEFSDAPAAVRYRLTERIFALEFRDAPVKFFSWMYRIGVLTSDKFVPKRATAAITDDFKARVGLLCELILIRDFMARLRVTESRPGYQKARALRRVQESLKEKINGDAFLQLENESHFYMRLAHDEASELCTLTFNMACLGDDAYLHDFLGRFARKHWRSRFWTGSQRSWVGVVGAGMIWDYHSLVDPKRKITRNGNDYCKSDKTDTREKTVAELICQKLNEHGFECRAGSLYETYLERYRKQPGGLFKRATVYHSLQQKMDVVFPAWCYDPFYSGVITTSTSSHDTEGDATRSGHTRGGR